MLSAAGNEKKLEGFLVGWPVPLAPTGAGVALWAVWHGAGLVGDGAAVAVVVARGFPLAIVVNICMQHAGFAVVRCRLRRAIMGA